MAKGLKQTFNKSQLSKIKMPSVGAWLTNAGKSIGVASMDVIQEILPATSELAGSVGEYGQSIKDMLREAKKIKPDGGGGMVSKYVDIGKEAITNVKADLKSGKLYHSMDEMYSEMNGDEFGDIDFGDDFSDDFSDGDFDSNFESEDGTTTVQTKHRDEDGVSVSNVQVNVDVDKRNQISSSIQSQTKIAVDIGNTQTKALEKTGNNVLSGVSSLSTMLSGYLGSVDSNVTSMVGVVSTIAQNSSVALKYYEDSMNQFKIISEATVAIRDSLLNGNPAGPENQLPEYNDVLDIFSGSGAIDLSAYAKLVKKQFGRAIDSNLFTSQIKFMLSDPDQIRAMVAHPLSNVISGAIKGLLKNSLKEAATQFDNTLSEFVTAGLTNIAGLGGDGGMIPGLDIIGKTLGIRNTLKSSVDKTNYRKGKVDWTGQDKKTLNEVIPYYLRKISASLSGGREEAFDYTKGIFRTVKDITDEYRRDDERNLIGGLSSVTSDFKEFLNNKVQFTNSNQSEEAIKSMNKLLVNLVKGNFTIRRSNGSFRKAISEVLGTNDTATLDLLSAFIDNRSHADNMYLFGRGLQESRTSATKKKMQEEAGELLSNQMYMDNGTSFDTHLNTTKKGEVTGIKRTASPFIDVDRYGKTPVNYLREISKSLSNGIVVFPNGGFGGGSGPSISGNERIIADRTNYEKKQKALDDIRDKVKNNTSVGSFTSPMDNYEYLLKLQAQIEKEFKEAEEAYNKTIADLASGNNVRPDYANTLLKTYKDQESVYDTVQNRINKANNGTNYTKEEMENKTKGGKIAVTLNGTDDSNYAQLSASAKDFIENNKENEEASWFTKVTGLKEDKPITKIVNKFTEYLQKPSNILTDFFKKADTFLFNIVFGDEGIGPGTSLVSRITDSIKMQFTKVSTWLNDNILEPLHENLFGDEGIITQLKETTVGQAISDKLDGAKDFFFGKKVLMEDGSYQREGGVFSNLINEFKSTGKDLVDTAKTTVADSINAVHDFIKPKNEQEGEIVATAKIRAGKISKDTASKLKIGGKTEKVRVQYNDATFQKYKDRLNIIDSAIKKAGDDEEKVKNLTEYKNTILKKIEGYKQHLSESGEDKSDKTKIKTTKIKKKKKNTDGGGLTPDDGVDSGNVDGHFAEGIDEVPRTGTYVLTKGETVINNGDVAGSEKAEAQYVYSIKRKETAGEKLKNAVDSLTTDLVGRFKERANSFGEAIFGGDKGKKRKEALDAVSIDLKGKGAKVAANVGFGILTSIFMPWGIVGGALVGLGRGLIKNSETVKKILFGDLDENGKRQGNIISKNIIDTIDENKTGVKMGAIAGLASVIGLLPAVWGGTLTYMAGGLAISMAGKSEFIQKWLFGEMGEDGKRVGGGFADKIKSAFGKDYKKLGLDIGIGAGVGIIGSFFLPGGPIIGALVGAAASIATNTEKFKSFFFGDKDPDTGKRKGGLMGKFSDAVIMPFVNAFRDLEDKVVGWFEQKVLIPIQTSIAAIGEFLYNKINTGVDMVVNVFKSVGSYIGNKIVTTTKKLIKPLFDPLISGTKKVFNFFMKSLGNVLAVPFTLLGQLGIMADKSNRHKNAKDYNKNTLGNALTFSKKKRAKKGLEENISLGDRIKSFGDFFNRKKRKEAITPGYSEDGKTVKEMMKDAREESKAWIAYKSYMRKHGMKDKMVSRKEFDAGKNPEGKVYSKWKTGSTVAGKVSDTVDKVIKNANIDSNETVVHAKTVIVNGGKRTAKEAFGKDYEKFVENWKKKNPDKPLPFTEEEFFLKKIKYLKHKKDAHEKDKEFYDRTTKKGKKDKKDKKGDKKDGIDPDLIDDPDDTPNHADGVTNNSKPYAAIINTGETVIPSDDPDAKKKELKFIENLKRRKKERDEQRKKDSSGFINQFILRYQAHQAERQGKQKEADELKKAQEAGSYETRAKLAREAAEQKERKSFRDKILEGITSIKDTTAEHLLQFKEMFGKAGKIALVLLAGIPVIRRVARIIKNTFAYGNSITDFIDNFKKSVKDEFTALYDNTLGRLFENIKSGWADNGGAQGALNRLKKQGNDIKEIFNFNSDKPFLERLAAYVFPEDENGNNTIDHLTRVKLKAAGMGVGHAWQKTAGKKGAEYLEQIKANKRAAKNGGLINGFDDTLAGRAADYDLRTKAYKVNKKNARIEFEKAQEEALKATEEYEKLKGHHDRNKRGLDIGTRLQERFGTFVEEHGSKLSRLQSQLDIDKDFANKQSSYAKSSSASKAKHQSAITKYENELAKLGKDGDSKKVKQLESLLAKEKKKLAKADKIAKEANDRLRPYKRAQEEAKRLASLYTGEKDTLSKAEELIKKSQDELDKEDAAKEVFDKANDKANKAFEKFDNIKKQDGNTFYDKLDKLIEKAESYKKTVTYDADMLSTGKRAKESKKLKKLYELRNSATDPKRKQYYQELIDKRFKKIADKSVPTNLETSGFLSTKTNDFFNSISQSIEKRGAKKANRLSRIADGIEAGPIKTVAGKVADAGKSIGETVADAAKYNKVSEFGRRTGEKLSGTKLGKKMAESKADRVAKRAAKNAAKGGSLGERTAKKATKLAEQFSETKAGKFTKSVTNLTKKTTSVANRGGSKLIKLASSAVSHVSGLFSKLFKNSGKLATKAMGSIDKLLQKAIKVVSKSSKFIKKSGEILAKVAKGAVPVINGIFMGVGVVSGYYDASNLFAVDKDNVDKTMKMVSAVWGALKNTSLGGIFDVINEIASEILGFNIVREISTLAYNALASDEDAKNLKEAQDKFKENYNSMVEGEYQKFINDEKNGEARYVIDKETGEKRQITTDEFRQMGKVKSFEEYNSQKHKTIARTVGDKLIKGKKLVKDGVTHLKTKSVSDAFSKDYWKQDKMNADGTMKTEQELVADRGKKIMNLPITIIKGLLGDVINGFDAVVRSVKTTIKDFGSNTKTAFNIKSGTEVFQEKWWTPPTSGDDKSKEGIETSSLTKIAFYINRIIMFIPAMVTGVVKGVGNAIGDIIVKIRSAFSGISEAGGGFANAFGSITSVTSVLSGKWWTPPKDEKGNPFSVGQRALFYGSRVLAFIPGVFVGLFQDLKKVLDPVIAPIKDAIESVTGMDFDKEPKKVDKLGVNKFLYYGAKALEFIPKAVCAMGKKVGEFVGPIIDALKPVMTAIMHDVTTAIETSGGNHIFRPEYWSYSGRDDNGKDLGLGGLRKVIFYGVRILYAPIGLVVGAIKTVAGMILPVVKGVVSIGAFAVTNLAFDVIDTVKGGVGAVFTGDFWTPKGIGNNDEFGGLKSILFYAARVLLLPVWLTLGLASDVVRNLGTIVKGAISIGGFILGIAGDATIGAIQGGLPRVCSSDYWTPNVSDNDQFGGIKRALFLSLKFITLPVALTLGAVSSVVTTVVALVKGAISIGSFVVGTVVDGEIQIIKGGLGTLFSSDYWTPKVDDSDQFSGLKKVVFYAIRIMNLPQSTILAMISTVATNLWTFVKGVFSVGVYIGKLIVGDTVDMVSGGITTIFSKKFWTPNVDKNDSFGSIKQVAFWIVKILSIPRNLVLGLFGSALKGFKALLNVFLDCGKASLAGMDTSKVKSFGDTFKGANKFSGIAKFIFYVNRVIGMVGWVFSHMFDGIVDFFGGIFKGIKGIFTDPIGTIKSALGFGDAEPIGGNGETNFRVSSPKLSYAFAGGNGGDEPETVNGNPYYSQNDPKRKNKSYKVSHGKSMYKETMGSRGCGPTAMAMVASKVKGGMGTNPYTPENMAALAEESNYSTNAGTTPGYFTDIGTKLGMNVTPAFASKDNVDAMLDSGQPVILQGKSNKKSSPYTKSGHYVVAVGKDKNGNVIVNDPRGKKYSKAYTMDEITDGSGAAWSFSDANKRGHVTNRERFSSKLAGGNGNMYKYALVNSNGQSPKSSDNIKDLISYASKKKISPYAILNASGPAKGHYAYIKNKNVAGYTKNRFFITHNTKDTKQSIGSAKDYNAARSWAERVKPGYVTKYNSQGVGSVVYTAGVKSNERLNMYYLYNSSGKIIAKGNQLPELQRKADRYKKSQIRSAIDGHVIYNSQYDKSDVGGRRFQVWFKRNGRDQFVKRDLSYKEAVALVNKKKDDRYFVLDPNKHTVVYKYNPNDKTKGKTNGKNDSKGKGKGKGKNGGNTTTAVAGTTSVDGTVSTTEAQTVDAANSADGEWIEIVREVKRAIADQKVGYSHQQDRITITVKGKTLKVRTDCSGYVVACLKVYGALGMGDNMSSGSFATNRVTALEKAGFTHLNWTSWDDLREGDIIARSGHVEIFAYNKDGTHYVYNCGDDDPCNNPNPTPTTKPHKHVWRPKNGNGTTAAGGSVGYIGALTKLAEYVMSPYKKLLYGDSGTDSSSETGSSNGSTSVVTGNSNEEKVWNYFTSKGYSPEATAGIMGNIYQESKFNPGLIQGNGKGPAAGLFQWENYNKKTARWKNLNDRAKSNGKDWTDLATQLDFANAELPEQNTYFKKKKTIEGHSVGATTYDKFKQSTDVTDATYQFEKAFERAGKPKMPTRLKAAKDYYDKFNKGGNGDVLLGGNGDATISSNSGTSYKTDYPSFDYGFGGGFGFDDDTPVGTTTYKVNSSGSLSSNRIDEKVNRSQKLNDSIQQYNDEKLLSVLGNISSGIQDSVSELRGTNKGINQFNSKNFSQKAPVVIAGNGNTTNNITQNDNKKVSTTKKRNSSFLEGNYDIAKQIARGTVTV